MSVGPYAVLCAGKGGRQLAKGVQNAPAIGLDHTQRDPLGVVLQERDATARRVARAVGVPCSVYVSCGSSEMDPW